MVIQLPTSADIAFTKLKYVEQIAVLQMRYVGKYWC